MFGFICYQVLNKCKSTKGGSVSLVTIYLLVCGLKLNFNEMNYPLRVCKLASIAMLYIICTARTHRGTGKSNGEFCGVQSTAQL